VRLLVDTGVFSAALSRRRRPEFEPWVARLPGNQLNLAVQTVAELRFGGFVANWGDARRRRLEGSIRATTVVPVTDALVNTVAQLRFDCRSIGHPIAAAPHHSDLWIAATAIHIGAQLVTADGVFQAVPGLVRAG
jgi:predicted nucleic acid-binding protein